MSNGIFKLDWVNVKSSLVYGGLWGLLAVLIRIKEVGNIFNLNWMDLANVFAMAAIAIVIVLLKNMFTTDSGKFLGVVSVTAPKIK